MIFQKKDFSSELNFKTSRSSGKGGQHVNKTESRVSLFFNVPLSRLLTKEEKELLISKLNLNQEGIIQIDTEESRSQLKNKEKCVKKFYELISKNLTVQKKRKPTKPSKSAIRRRLKDKKRRSDIKKDRRADY